MTIRAARGQAHRQLGRVLPGRLPDRGRARRDADASGRAGARGRRGRRLGGRSRSGRRAPESSTSPPPFTDGAGAHGDRLRLRGAHRRRGPRADEVSVRQGRGGTPTSTGRPTCTHRPTTGATSRRCSRGAPSSRHSGAQPDGRADRRAVDQRHRSTARATSTRSRRASCSSDCLREELGLTGTRVGCEHGECGACTCWVDGETVSACMCSPSRPRALLTTVEGLCRRTASSTPLQQAFWRTHALQCGYCTPGMLMHRRPSCSSANPQPSEAEIRPASRATSAAARATCTSSRAIESAARKDRSDLATTCCRGEDGDGHRAGDRAPGSAMPARRSRARRTGGFVQGEGVFADDVKRARDGLRPLRALAVRPREDRLGRRLGGGGDGGRLRDADSGRGRGADRSVLRADDAAREPDQGLRARGRLGAGRRRAGRRGRGLDARASRATRPT